MTNLINEIQKIEELSLQIENKTNRIHYVLFCSYIANINGLMLINNKSFEDITYQYMLQTFLSLNTSKL